MGEQMLDPKQMERMVWFAMFGMICLCVLFLAGAVFLGIMAWRWLGG